MTINPIIPFLAARAKEASSHAGAVCVLLAAMHVNTNPDLVNAILAAVAAIGGVLAILVPEQKKETP